jgi:hypothetical protein
MTALVVARVNRVPRQTRRRRWLDWSSFEKAEIVERAELICERSAELAALAVPLDVGDVAIDLLRAAENDKTILRHALRIGRLRIERGPGDESVRKGVRLLEAVLAFLSSKPRAVDVAAAGSASTSVARADLVPSSSVG